MNETIKWAVGIAMALVALVGLVMASRAQDDVFYFAGLLFFVFGVVFDYALIAASDERERESASSAGD